MHNRDNIKWAPFNAVMDGNKVICDLLKQKNRKTKPLLSEEQIAELEEKIVNSYNFKTPVEIIYLKNYSYIKITGIIKNIDSIDKKIVLNNQISLYFANIIKISEKNT